MKPGSRRLLLAATAGMTVVWLIGVGLAASGNKIGDAFALANAQTGAARGQAAPPARGGQAAPPSPAARGQAAYPPGTELSEQAFKNVTALTGIPVDEFMDTMGLFSAALSMCCAECHTGAGTDQVDWALDTPRKRTARRMVTMVAAINRDNFGGRQVVTCWSCHRGRDRPVTTASIDTIYGTPSLEPDDILPRAPTGPSVEQILDKYLQAIGGADRVARLTSYVAKGTSVGFGGFSGGRPVEIYAKFPDQRATIIHTDDGDLTRAFDGRTGWIATPLTLVKEYELVSSELDGARFDAQMAFPGQIKQILTNSRVSFSTTIDDREVEVVQGNGARGLLVNLYFDKQSSLLVRMVRYANSVIGRVPTQVDFADYRDVAGVKIPFRWTYAWVDGRDQFELTEVQPNVPVDAAKFGKPPLPTPRAR